MFGDFLSRRLTSEDGPLIIVQKIIAISGPSTVYLAKTSRRELVLKRIRFEKQQGQTCCSLFRRSSNNKAAQTQARRVPIENIENEIDLLWESKSRFVLKIFDSIWDSSSCWIVTELCCCDAELLGDFRYGNGMLMDFKLMYHVMIPIIKAISHIHSLGIFHGDVKPANILITPKGVPKLSDFGGAKHIKPNMVATSLFGTVDFIPPELYRRSKYDERIDVWSWCLSALHLLRSVEHRFLKTANQLVNHYKKADLKDPASQHFVDKVLYLVHSAEVAEEEQEFRDWMRDICLIDCEERPTAAEVCETEMAKKYLKAWDKKGKLYREGHQLLYEDVCIKNKLTMVRRPDLLKPKPKRRDRPKPSKLMNFLTYIY